MRAHVQGAEKRLGKRQEAIYRACVALGVQKDSPSPPDSLSSKLLRAESSSSTSSSMTTACFRGFSLAASIGNTQAEKGLRTSGHVHSGVGGEQVYA